ncbi:MAG: DUF4339 domain-containing protein, partial [Planctomycetales bacterium]|nr:DUF4339 domain-containing protein [Planctomycetales bacterium]
VPPPPPGFPWHVSLHGHAQGPFDADQLAHQIRTGQVTPATHVWTPALGTWRTASEVPQLAPYFNAGSPPPPPPGG